MKRLPALLSFVLLLVLCASLSYWLLQWLAPAPRAAAAPPMTKRPVPPLAAARNLFGTAQASGPAGVQLRGIIHSGRAAESMAILAVEGKPPRAIGTKAEVMPGMQLKEVRASSVIVSDQGRDRELSLPEFAAQSAATAQVAGMSGVVPNAVMPANPAAAPGVATAGTATGASTTGNAVAGADAAAPVPTAPQTVIVPERGR